MGYTKSITTHSIWSELLVTILTHISIVNINTLHILPRIYFDYFDLSDMTIIIHYFPFHPSTSCSGKGELAYCHYQLPFIHYYSANAFFPFHIFYILLSLSALKRGKLFYSQAQVVSPFRILCIHKYKSTST